MSLLKLDHVVMACSNLQAGADWLEQRLGVSLAPGGQHQGFGTHNRLLHLGQGTYLELIAPDPTQAAPRQPRPFGLDRYCPQQPELIHHVVSTRDVTAALAALPYAAGPAIAMQRGALQWKIAVANPDDEQQDAVLPTVIEWPQDVHPCSQLPPQGIFLEHIVLNLEPDQIGRMQPLLADGRVVWRASSRRWLGLALQTPQGLQFFNSRRA